MQVRSPRRKTGRKGQLPTPRMPTRPLRGMVKARMKSKRPKMPTSHPLTGPTVNVLILKVAIVVVSAVWMVLNSKCKASIVVVENMVIFLLSAALFPISVVREEIFEVIQVDTVVLTHAMVDIAIRLAMMLIVAISSEDEDHFSVVDNLGMDGTITAI